MKGIATIKADNKGKGGRPAPRIVNGDLVQVRVSRFKLGNQGRIDAVGIIHRIVRRTKSWNIPAGCTTGPLQRIVVFVVDYKAKPYELRWDGYAWGITLPGKELS